MNIAPMVSIDDTSVKMSRCPAVTVLGPTRISDNTHVPTGDSADFSRITVMPGQRSGQPCIRGLRVTVWDVLDMLASGMTEDEILNGIPVSGEGRFSGGLCLRLAGRA